MILEMDFDPEALAYKLAHNWYTDLIRLVTALDEAVGDSVFTGELKKAVKKL